MQRGHTARRGHSRGRGSGTAGGMRPNVSAVRLPKGQPPATWTMPAVLFLCVYKRKLLLSIFKMGHEWPVALGRRPLVRVSLLQFTPRAVVDLPLGWLSYTEAKGNDRTQTGVRTRATYPPRSALPCFRDPRPHGASQSVRALAHAW